MTKISQNLTKSDEGYLICHNVKIAHTKPMKYYVADTGEYVDIANSRDILQPEFYENLAGKPFVVEHPAEKVTSENYTKYIKGAIIRAFPVNDDLVADLVVYDKHTQDLILSGKREVSIQVDAHLVELSNGQYTKVPVSFNHLALVDKGRAGKEYRINDSEDKMEENQMVTVPTSFFEKLFGKKDKEKDETKTFSDAEEKINALEKGIAFLTEKMEKLEELISSKEQKTFSDGEETLIPAICEFIPFRKGMNVEQGVKAALNSALLSPVGSSVERMLGGQDAFSLPFSDAQTMLLSAFELKKAVNNNGNVGQIDTNIPAGFKGISGAELNDLYNKNNGEK